ncbi:MAG: hypothetical protein IJL37_02380 [Bacteroidaceae bacterium]|nr:hypothetical protein [Bacteroidaceae bacterium]
METMKKQWGKPLTNVQEFVPSEFCAPCGDGTTEVTYYFMCDGGWGNTHYNVWLDNNPQDNQLTGVWRQNFWGNWQWANNDQGDHDTWLTSGTYYYHSCQEAHTVTVPKGTSVDDIFPYGFMQVKGDRDGEIIPVRIWRGDNNDDIHCTRTLNSSEFTPHNPS